MTGDWQLERFRLGELEPSEMAAMRERLSADAALRARLAALDGSDAELLGERPATTVASAIRARAAAAPRRSSWLRPALAALALAAAVIVFVPRNLNPPDEIRTKGIGPRLLLYRRAAPEVEALAPGSVAAKDDVVQIAYVAAGRRFGAIVSIDGRGVVTRHLPAAGSTAAALEPGGPHALLQAYRLDDAPSFERFYFVASAEPFSVEAVVAAVTTAQRPPAIGRLELPPALDQASFELRKAPR